MVRCLKENTREVYTMELCPNINRLRVPATASYDAIVKKWDINTGRCLRTVSDHTDPVYSMAYSSDGQFLASGSFDRGRYIRISKDGALINDSEAQALYWKWRRILLDTRSVHGSAVSLSVLSIYEEGLKFLTTRF